MNERPRNPVPAVAQGVALESTGADTTVDGRLCSLLAREAIASGVLASELGVPLRTVQYRLGRLAAKLATLAPRIKTELVAPLQRIADARDAAAATARQARTATERQRKEAREQAKQIDRYIARLQRLHQRAPTKPTEDVLAELLHLGCVTECSKTYVVEVPPSLIERAGDLARSIWNGVASAPAAMPAPVHDPYDLGRGSYVALPQSLPATAKPGANRAPAAPRLPRR